LTSDLPLTTSISWWRPILNWNKVGKPSRKQCGAVPGRFSKGKTLLARLLDG
jgi:hypothetical protein